MVWSSEESPAKWSERRLPQRRWRGEASNTLSPPQNCLHLKLHWQYLLANNDEVVMAENLIYIWAGNLMSIILIPEKPGVEFSICAKYLSLLICMPEIARWHSRPRRVMTPHSLGWATPLQSIINNTAPFSNISLSSVYSTWWQSWFQ